MLRTARSSWLLLLLLGAGCEAPEDSLSFRSSLEASASMSSLSEDEMRAFCREGVEAQLAAAPVEEWSEADCTTYGLLSERTPEGCARARGACLESSPVSSVARHCDARVAVPECPASRTVGEFEACLSSTWRRVLSVDGWTCADASMSTQDEVRAALSIAADCEWITSRECSGFPAP